MVWYLPICSGAHFKHLTQERIRKQIYTALYKYLCLHLVLFHFSRVIVQPRAILGLRLHRKLELLKDASNQHMLCITELRCAAVFADIFCEYAAIWCCFFRDLVLGSERRCVAYRM